jgi:hypothetical protein
VKIQDWMKEGRILSIHHTGGRQQLYATCSGCALLVWKEVKIDAG